MTSESGTGVVHQAPGFGEDDFRVCLHYGILKKVCMCVCVCVCVCVSVGTSVCVEIMMC